MQSSMMQKTRDPGVKLDIIKEQIRKTLRDNDLCCCAADGSFVCNNCALVLVGLFPKRGDNCQNCRMSKRASRCAQMNTTRKVERGYRQHTYTFI